MSFDTNDPNQAAKSLDVILERLTKSVEQFQNHQTSKHEISKNMRCRRAIIDFNQTLMDHHKQILSFSRSKMQSLGLNELDLIAEIMDQASNIMQSYKPEKATIKSWINYWIDKRILSDGLRRRQRSDQRVMSLDDFESEEGELGRRSIADLVRLINEKEHQQIVAQEHLLLRRIIEENKDNKFSEVIKKHDIRWQVILIHLLNGKSLKQISDELSIPYQTLYSFHQKQLKKHGDYLRDCLSNIIAFDDGDDTEDDGDDIRGDGDRDGGNTT